MVVLSGGVGGARMARGLAAVLPADGLTAVVNVGDDDDVYGVRVCADLDTVTHTLAGIEGPHGWGIAGDTFTVMDHLATVGVDTTFRLGDRDLATCLLRTSMLAAGEALSTVTEVICARLGVLPRLLPATDDPLRTRVHTVDGEWLAFQEYFVMRGHRDDVDEVLFDDATEAHPAPGVVEAIDGSDVVVVAPSNPVLSIWPILAVPGLRDAVARHPTVVAVSPLFDGRALRGPADRVLAGHGLPPGNAGIVAAYDGLLSDLVVDSGDDADVARLSSSELRVHTMDTRIADLRSGTRLAGELVAAVR